MFKKHISEAGKHQLSGKDAKTLKRDILKQYPTVTEDQLNELLPGKSNLVQTKLNNRCVVYGAEGGNPLFFDIDGRGDKLLPTVYALWALPQLVSNTLPTWSEVSPKILGGADLFLQGVLARPEQLGDWLAGSVRTVTIPGNPAAFAVGRMAVSKTEALRDGMKGRGLTLIHHYPDLLWAMGDKSVPNEGFTTQRIFPLAQPAEAPLGGDGSASEAAAEAGGDAAGQLQGLSLSEGAAAAADASNGEGAGQEPGSAAGEAAAGGDLAAAPQSMDEMLEAAVISGLRRVTNAELPMQTGDFYTKHMQAVKPEGVTFDFKQSKYKKLSKLLDKFEKDKVLTQKVIRKQDNISAINRSHPLLVAAAAAEGAAAGNSNSGGGKAGGGGSSSSGSGSGSGSGSSAKVAISYCYRAPSSLRPMFGEAGKDKDRLYSGAEVEAALRQYTAAAGLLPQGAGDVVKLDALMQGSLFNKKEPQKAGDTVPLQDVLARLIDKLQLHHRLVRPGEQGNVEVVRKGQVKPVHIGDEKRSGRDVTKVSHVESFALVAEELADVLKKKFQCSATVNELPGKAEHDKEIMLQGKLARQVAEFLTSTYGIPANLMEVKTGKK